MFWWRSQRRSKTLLLSEVAAQAPLTFLHLRLSINDTYIRTRQSAPERWSILPTLINFYTHQVRSWRYHSPHKPPTPSYPLPSSTQPTSTKPSSRPLSVCLKILKSPSAHAALTFRFFTSVFRNRIQVLKGTFVIKRLY